MNLEGILTIFIQPCRICLVLTELFTKLEISNKIGNDKQSLNIQHILVTFEISNFGIFGGNERDLHPKNIFSILITLDVFHFDISNIFDKDEHP